MKKNQIKSLLETVVLYQDYLLSGKKVSHVKMSECFNDSQNLVKKRKSVDIEEVNDFPTLETIIQGCLKCRLGKSRNHIVFGSGNFNAPLYVIGEAPGFEEDVQGKPFVGRSGKFIRAELKKTGIDEDQMYITNVVKCRPPNNRDPQFDEIESCKQYLQKQLILSKPKVILALGRFAGSYVLGNPEKPYSLASMRGSIHQVNQSLSSCIVTYHPSALLRGNKQWLESFYQDIQLLKKQLNPM